MDAMLRTPRVRNHLPSQDPRQVLPHRGIHAALCRRSTTDAWIRPSAGERRGSPLRLLREGGQIAMNNPHHYESRDGLPPPQHAVHPLRQDGPPRQPPSGAGFVDPCGFCGEAYEAHRAASGNTAPFCMSPASRPGDTFHPVGGGGIDALPATRTAATPTRSPSSTKITRAITGCTSKTAGSALTPETHSITESTVRRCAIKLQSVVACRCDGVQHPPARFHPHAILTTPCGRAKI